MYPTNNAPKHIPIDVKTHPEWNKFASALEARNIPENMILMIWTKTLMGIKLQDEMNKTGRRKEVNPHFAAVAELMENELRVLPAQTMALWSGGYDVSEYARKRKGCTTLESTLLGGVFDTLQLYSDWKCIGPLWNAISRKFVEGGHGIIHVFIRVHAPDSVLYLKEIPAIERNIGDEAGLPDELRVTGVLWHALFGDGAWHGLKEIDNQGRLVENFTFPTEGLARMAMKNFLVRRSQTKQTSTHATKEMKID